MQVICDMMAIQLVQPPASLSPGARSGQMGLRPTAKCSVKMLRCRYRLLLAWCLLVLAYHPLYVRVLLPGTKATSRNKQTLRTARVDYCPCRRACAVLSMSVSNVNDFNGNRLHGQTITSLRAQCTRMCCSFRGQGYIEMVILSAPSLTP